MRKLAALGAIVAGALGLALGAQAQTTVDITGAHDKAENSCSQIFYLFGGLDCTYTKQRDAGAFAGWSGPGFGASYYAVGSAQDDPAYVPSVGDDGDIQPTITGTLILNGSGAGATIEGTIVVGSAARNIATGASTRAVERWDTITHTLAATAVDSATANGDGGFDYIIGVNGEPGSLCLTSDPTLCFAQDDGANTTAGPAGYWNNEIPPTVGIERATTTGGPNPNIGATTTGVLGGYSCSDQNGTNCIDSTLLWGAAEDPGWDNFILVVSTNANGDITAGTGYWTQEYTITAGAPTPDDNSWAASRFTFTGTCQTGCAGGPTGPAASDDAATTLEATLVNIDVLSNDSFGANPVVAIDTAPGNGGAVVNPDNTVDYTPNGGFTGDDTFVYSLSDDDGGPVTATVTVTVEADLLPTAPDGSLALDTQGQNGASAAASVDVATLPGYVAGNSPASVDCAGSAPASGTVSCSGTSITYTPNDDFVDGGATDSFDYILRDGTGDEDTGTISVSITDVQPGLEDESLELDQDTEAGVTLSVTPGNGTPAQHTIAVSSDASNGSCALDGFDVNYTPDADFAGDDSCEVTLTDADGDEATAVISITVNETGGVVIGLPGGNSALDLWSLSLLGGLPLLRRRRRHQ